MKMNLVVAAVGVAALLLALACGVLLFLRAPSASAFEYRVCLTQGSRVTFVNGSWQGHKPMDTADPKASMDSCPEKWEYLAAAGRDGWELVTVVPLTHLQDQQAQELYLRRVIK
jgi:hypothetical protein